MFETPNTISTGEPATLGTYKKIAVLFGEKAQKYIQDQIDKAPNGEDEGVIAHESQMLMLLASFIDREA